MAAENSIVELAELIDEAGEEENQKIIPSPIDGREDTCYAVSLGKTDFISELRVKLDFHKKQVEVWQAALDSALGKNQDNGQREKAATSTKGQQKRARPESPVAHVFEVIKQSGGSTPAEIKAKTLQEFTGPLGRNYPYKQLIHLKSAGRIEKRDGKYVIK
jgi:hypothetical protein